MKVQISKRAKEIIAEIQYVTVASIDKDGMPWNAPVFAAYDNAYNFYWGTHKFSQKAQNIQKNKNVFLVIYDSTAPSGAGEGVYIKAIAQKLTDPEQAKRVFELLKTRHVSKFWDFSSISQEGPIRLYKATPQKVWMNNEDNKSGHYIDTRTEVKL